MNNARPLNMVDLYEVFRYLPRGTAAKIAGKTGFSVQYVHMVLGKKRPEYNYQIIKEAVKHLPEELRERAVLKF